MRQAVKELLAFIRTRKTDYQLTFSSPAGQAVLRDLAKFCRANETCFHEDARLHAVLEGRREVWLRIQQHFHLTTDQLADLCSGRTLKPTEFSDEDQDRL